MDNIFYLNPKTILIYILNNCLGYILNKRLNKNIYIRNNQFLKNHHILLNFIQEYHLHKWVHNDVVIYLISTLQNCILCIQIQYIKCKNFNNDIYISHKYHFLSYFHYYKFHHNLLDCPHHKFLHTFKLIILIYILKHKLYTFLYNSLNN